jgi:hypothetical protein
MAVIRHIYVVLILMLVLSMSCSRDNSTTPTIDTVPPLPPVGVEVSYEGGDMVRVSWAPNSEADLAGYVLYRSLGTETFGAVVPQPLLCPWCYDHVPAMQAATFKVTAMDESGNESAYSEPVGVYMNGSWRDRDTDPVDNR